MLRTQNSRLCSLFSMLVLISHRLVLNDQIHPLFKVLVNQMKQKQKLKKACYIYYFFVVVH